MKNRNEELKRKLKKAASISLCAVLAGGLAAGTYTGVNYLTGYEQSVQAASKEQITLLKSDKESDDSDSKEESTANRMIPRMTAKMRVQQRVALMYLIL